MEPIYLVRASVVLPFVKFLDRIGAPTERFLQKSHLPAYIVSNPETLIPLTQSFAFAELAARTEGIENLGLIVGQQTPLSQLGAFGTLVCQSLTLHDLFYRILKLHNALISGERIWLTEDGDDMWLHHQYLVPRHIQTHQGQYYSILMYLNAIRLATGLDWQPNQLHLQNSRNKAFLDLDFLANTPIHFNQPTNAIRFSKTMLSKPLIHLTKPSLSCNTEETLKLTAPAASFTDSLYQLICSLLPEGYPNLPIAAAAAGMSVRTFQRRLEANNLNYSQLVEQVRFKQAVHLLRDSTNKLIDIAFDLGYSDAANFSRAFKRWTGMSPREFRESLLTRESFAL